MTVKNICSMALSSAFLFGLSACGGGGNGAGSTGVAPTVSPATPAASTDGSYADPVVYSNAPNASLPSATEAAAITHHEITVNGQLIQYTATAGHLTATNPKTGAPEASYFYIAYTADNATTTKRPLTFFLSGGPGNSQAGLHIESFAPRRLVTNVPSLNEPTSPQLVDNPDSMIDTSDMVFVDEVGTGYSEAIAPNTNASFWGVDADAASYSNFVTRYLAVNQRASSPLFLYGLSYGTARAALMSKILTSSGVKLAGLVLNSSVLNANTSCLFYEQTQGKGGNCSGSLPSYAAIAAYHKVTTPTAADLPNYLQQVRAFATTSYIPAVTAFVTAATAPDLSLTTQLAGYTGIASTVWQTRLGLGGSYFSTLLLPNQLIGAHDSRVVVPVASPLAANGQDPSETYIYATFGNSYFNYVTQELKYRSVSAYAYSIPSVTTWNTSHNGSPVPDGVPDLASALAQNPSLKILSLNGYYDLVTPFHQTELDMARLGANPNIQFKYYAGGHDTFLDNVARPLMKADMAEFYQRSAP
jgi:carboxypeptidase C (cathepsin A)